MEEVRVTELFQPISVTGFFDIETLAKDDGYNQHPDTGATTISASEKKIIHCFADLLNHKRSNAIDALATLEAKKSEIFVDGIIQSAEAIPDNLKDKVSSCLIGAREEMSHLQNAEQQEYSAKQIFMIENHLKRPAHYPLSHVFSFAIFAALVLAESLGNAYFFAANNEMGLFGGWLQAVIVSAANVCVLAGLAGTALRYCNHVIKAKKAGGLLAVVTCSAAGVAFNLLVAHFRVALEKNADTAYNEATRSFFENPFGIASFEGWVLFIVGIGCSMFACHKWNSLDDPYPGYGAIDRRHKQAQEACRHRQKKIQDAVAGFFDSAAKELNEALLTVEKQVRHFQILVGIGQSIFEKYPLFVTHVQDVCAHAVTSYRSINRSVRATPPPAYFNDPISITDPIGLPNMPTYHAEVEQLLAKRDLFVLETKVEISARLRDLREKVDEEIKSFFSKLEQEAKDRVKVELEGSRNV